MLPAHYNKQEASYFCRFTFGQFFTLLVLEIFTLFFIFYLGARYGREFLGIETPVAEQRAGLPEVTTTSSQVASTTADPEIRALAKDILEQAPPSDLKQRVEEMLGERERRTENREQKQKTETETENGKQKTENREPKVGNQELRTKNQEPQPVIQTAPENARYTIQIGSYNNVDEAHTMVTHWQEKGYPAYLTSADIPEKGRWYRVRVGGFENKELAQTYLDEFKHKEGVDAFIASNF